MKRDPDQERKIIADCLKNDWDELIRRFDWVISGSIRKTLARRGASNSPGDVEDLKTDAYIRLLENDCARLRRFNPELCSLKGYIAMIAGQAVLDKERREKKEPLAAGWRKISADETNILELLELKSLSSVVIN